MTKPENSPKETLLSKTFTTHKKQRPTTIDIIKKGSIVQRKCKQLIDELLLMFPNGIFEDEDLTYYIQKYIGADKETIRAYKGYPGSIRTGRCGDTKIVGLSRKGYLEKFFYAAKRPKMGYSNSDETPLSS